MRASQTCRAATHSRDKPGHARPHGEVIPHSPDSTLARIGLARFYIENKPRSVPRARASRVPYASEYLPPDAARAPSRIQSLSETLPHRDIAAKATALTRESAATARVIPQRKQTPPKDQCSKTSHSLQCERKQPRLPRHRETAGSRNRAAGIAIYGDRGRANRSFRDPRICPDGQWRPMRHTHRRRETKFCDAG